MTTRKLAATWSHNTGLRSDILEVETENPRTGKLIWSYSVTTYATDGSYSVTREGFTSFEDACQAIGVTQEEEI